MEDVRAAWLRALIDAAGPERRWVHAREVAAALSERRGMQRRATGHAAGANLRRLRCDGLAESEMADGWSWWRPTDAGVEAGGSFG